MTEMEKLMSQLWDFLKADSTERGSAVQEVKTNQRGELTVVLVDKVRVAELLYKVIEASALYPAGAVSGSYPCEDTAEMKQIHSLLQKYEKRKQAEAKESESRG